MTKKMRSTAFNHRLKRIMCDAKVFVFLLNFFQRPASLRNIAFYGFFVYFSTMNIKSCKTTQDKRQGDLHNNILCGCEK